MTPKADATHRVRGASPVAPLPLDTGHPHGRPSAPRTPRHPEGPPIVGPLHQIRLTLARQSSITCEEEPPYARPPPPELHRPLPPPPCPLAIERPHVPAGFASSTAPLRSTWATSPPSPANKFPSRLADPTDGRSGLRRPPLSPVPDPLATDPTATRGPPIGHVAATSLEGHEATLSDDLDVLISLFVAAMASE
jgi:hypothetical protein